MRGPQAALPSQGLVDDNAAMIPPNDLAAFTRHGGALDVARAMFPEAPEPWIDLSTGINPVAYPLGDIEARAWTSLPNAADLARLEEAARRRYQVPAQAMVVAAPGTQAIIQRLPALAEGRDIRVLGRTYGEYARVFAGSDVRIVSAIHQLAGADVAIVANPNNPDGRLLAPLELAVLARRVGMLVVDEAFMDALTPDHSLAPRLPVERGIVLRSFGKMYGLPGARLGFAVTSPDTAMALRDMLGPWPVSGPAISVATRALADDDWLAASRARLGRDAARLASLLGHVEARSIGGTPLFALFEHPAAATLFTTLARRGILTRPFEGAPTWLRFGLPGGAAAWARLESALRAFSNVAFSYEKQAPEAPDFRL